MTVRLDLDLADDWSPDPEDVREPDPQLVVVDPGGVYSLTSFADDRSGTDRGATLEWTARRSGVHLVAVTSPQGTGGHSLSSAIMSPSSGDSFEVVNGSFRARLDAMTHWLAVVSGQRPRRSLAWRESDRGSSGRLPCRRYNGTA